MLMPRALASFSIESEDQVLLVFSDGSERLASPKKLGGLLSSDDLAKVQRALALRKSFLDTHWPRAAGALVLGALLLGGYSVHPRLSELAEKEAPAPSSVHSTSRPLPIEAAPLPVTAPVPQVPAAPQQAASPALKSASSRRPDRGAPPLERSLQGAAPSLQGNLPPAAASLLEPPLQAGPELPALP